MVKRLKRRHEQREVRYEFKKRCIDELGGGKCSKCGIETHRIEIFDFHHVDAKSKAFKISTANGKYTWDQIKQELKKVVIVCCLCHRLLHNHKGWEKIL